jgi:hypothetical protein
LEPVNEKMDIDSETVLIEEVRGVLSQALEKSTSIQRTKSGVKIIFGMLAGSRAFNLNVASSDKVRFF